MRKFILPVALVGMLAGGCKPKVHQNPPQTIGQRTNQQGVVTQRIILESSYTQHTVLFTPEGPRTRTDGEETYFLEEPGKPRRELPIMFWVNEDAAYNYGNCLPVEGTNLWVVAGVDPVADGNKLRFVLFDENQIIRSKILTMDPGVASPESEYEFQDGNRTMVIRSPDGLEKYDVLSGTVTKLQK